MTTDTFTIQTLDGAMPVHRWQPEAGNGAGIVVVQEIFGVSDYVEDRCADLAAAGYTVYAPELYWRLPETPAFNPESEEYVTQGIEAMMRLDWAQTVSDVVDTLSALRADVQSKTALVGFCFGGGVAFNAAAESTPDALVSFYGSALPNLVGLAPKVTCPQLHIWGTADAYIPTEAQQTVREALTQSTGPVEWKVYEGAGHAFDNPNPIFHDKAASDAAWDETLTFLATYLG